MAACREQGFTIRRGTGVPDDMPTAARALRTKAIGTTSFCGTAAWELRRRRSSVTESIRQGGRPNTDFGRGFYLSTLKRQAVYWAWDRHYALSPKDRGQLGNHPTVLRFRVPRRELARLEALHFFVRPDHDNEDYWSLVHHCRKNSAAHPATGRAAVIHNHKCNRHAAPSRKGWYDLVIGPVAADWRQRVALVGYDQISFHTTAAADVLTDLIHSGDRGQFRIEDRLD